MRHHSIITVALLAHSLSALNARASADAFQFKPTVDSGVQLTSTSSVTAASITASSIDLFDSLQVASSIATGDESSASTQAASSAATGDESSASTQAASSTVSPAQSSTPSPRASPTPRFGAEGSWRWQALAAATSDFSGAEQLEFGGSLSWFFVEDFSIDFQIEGDYITQPVNNAWGGGATLLFRWHFINTDSWSLYGDAGSGLLGTTVNTPSGGTSFNFTPQAGGGFSYEISPDVRLMVGARWYHISNANTGETNPGRNSLMGYVMISFPF